MENISIRDARKEDAGDIARIYNPFILESVVTFEELAVTKDEITRRIHEITSAGYPYLVAETQSEVAGYAYASQWRSRSAYRFTAESTVYLDPVHSRKGIGSALYIALLERLKAMGMHVVMGVITLPNPSSIALHEKLGFKKAAHFAEVGYKFGRWLDVGYWQLNL
jgi:phosphinothricin acetyltransferase